MQLHNRSDGVDGHFCIKRYNHDGAFWEFWNEERQAFKSAGSIYFGERAALDKLKELKSDADVDSLISDIVNRRLI